MSLALRSWSLLRGRNIHHETTVIRQEVDLGSLSGMDSRQAGPGFPDRFAERFGGLRKLPQDRARTEAFVDRLRSSAGVPFAEVLLNAILAVEFSAAYLSRYYGGISAAKVVPGPAPQRPYLVWSCRIGGISRRAARAGLLGLAELLPEELRQPSRPEARGYDAAYASLKSFASKWEMGYNLAILVQAAEERKIPWERFSTKTLRLGQGRFQHIFYNSVTDQTSYVAQRTAQRKNVTNRVLAEHGIPVPRGICPANLKEAVAAAEKIGYPVVVKPVDGNAGGGVCVGIRTAEEVRSAYEHANRYGRKGVLVESLIQGDDHRLLVVKDRCVAATKRVRASVTGDGKKTIRELVDELNADPRRDGFTLLKVSVNREMKRLLEQSAYQLDTVLPEGEKFAVRSMANYHACGYTIDVTDQVHPNNRELAVLAARAVGLDVAGVDFLSPDISRSHKEVGGAIIEVNCRPGLDLHTWPAEGQPRDVAGAIIEAMIPPGTQGRVPVALIASARRDEPVTRALENVLRATGMDVAVVRRRSKKAPTDGSPKPERTRRLLRSVLADRRLEVLVRQASPRGAARQGLLLDACSVAALMIPADHTCIESERQGLRVIVEGTSGLVAVASNSGEALAAVRGLDPSRVALVSLDDEDATVAGHVRAGGLAAVLVGTLQGRTLVLRDRNGTLVSVPTEPGPLPARQSERQSLKSELFSIVLAHGLGMSGAEILSSMRPSLNDHADQRQPRDT